jgi:hypothetical protein
VGLKAEIVRKNMYTGALQVLKEKKVDIKIKELFPTETSITQKHYSVVDRLLSSNILSKRKEEGVYLLELEDEVIVDTLLSSEEKIVEFIWPNAFDKDEPDYSLEEEETGTEVEDDGGVDVEGVDDFSAAMLQCSNLMAQQLLVLDRKMDTLVTGIYKLNANVEKAGSYSFRAYKIAYSCLHICTVLLKELTGESAKNVSCVSLEEEGDENEQEPTDGVSRAETNADPQTES